MAHVQIRSKGLDAYELLVDGEDVSYEVLREGCMVDLSFDPPRLHVVIPVEGLDIDLPNAVIEALRVEDGDDD